MNPSTLSLQKLPLPQKENRLAGGSDADEWSIDRFERWVRVGVESYVLEEAGPAAFPEVADRILITGSLSQGLWEFADGLNAVRRDNLKHAIAQALSSLEPQERFVAVAEQLLAIAVAILAHPVLKVLACKIGAFFRATGCRGPGQPVRHDPVQRGALSYTRTTGR